MHNKIKDLREQKGLTQAELGRVVGCNQSNVARWESGAQKPELTTLLKLADIFGVSLDYLMGREERGA